MWRKKRVLVPLVLLAVLLVGYGFRNSLLSGVFQFLVVRDPLQPVDLIFVLNGDPTVRPKMAAALYQQGLSRRIAIARAEDSISVQAGAYPNVTDSNLTMLRAFGIPDSEVVELRTPGGAASTVDEAQALATYAKDQPVRSVIVVTSELHSRRARFIFRKVLSPMGITVSMAPVPDRKYSAADWWSKEDGVVGCQNEYLKLAFYHLKY